MKTKTLHFTTILCLAFTLLTCVSYADESTSPTRARRFRGFKVRTWMGGIAVCGLLLGRYLDEKRSTQGDIAAFQAGIQTYSYPSLSDEDVKTKEGYLKRMQPIVRATRATVVAQGPQTMIDFSTLELEAIVKQLALRYPDLASAYGIPLSFTPSELPQFGMGDFWEGGGKLAFTQRVFCFWITRNHQNLDAFVMEGLGHHYDDHPAMSQSGARAQHELWRLMKIFSPSAIPNDP